MISYRLIDSPQGSTVYTTLFSIEDSKRRKRSTTLSAEEDSLETEEEVTCSEDNQVEENGVCGGYSHFNSSVLCKLHSLYKLYKCREVLFINCIEVL